MGIVSCIRVPHAGAIIVGVCFNPSLNEKEQIMRDLPLYFSLFAAALAMLASASKWEIAPELTSAQFAIRHMMVSTVRGTIGPVTGHLILNEADPTKSTVEASIAVSGIDTREAKRDTHLKSPDFFDVEKHPKMTFRSKSVTKSGDTQYKVVGDLTIRGVTREVTLEVEGNPKPIKDPFGNLRIGGEATTTLSRKAFGIEWSQVLDTGGFVVGDEVNVIIDIELIRKPDKS